MSAQPEAPYLGDTDKPTKPKTVGQSFLEIPRRDDETHEDYYRNMAWWFAAGVNEANKDERLDPDQFSAAYIRYIAAATNFHWHSVGRFYREDYEA